MRSEGVHDVIRRIATVVVWAIAAILLAAAVYMAVTTDSLLIRLGLLAAVIWAVVAVYMMHRGAMGLARLYSSEDSDQVSVSDRDTKSGGSGA